MVSHLCLYPTRPVGSKGNNSLMTASTHSSSYDAYTREIVVKLFEHLCNFRSWYVWTLLTNSKSFDEILEFIDYSLKAYHQNAVKRYRFPLRGFTWKQPNPAIFIQMCFLEKPGGLFSQSRRWMVKGQPYAVIWQSSLVDKIPSIWDIRGISTMTPPFRQSRLHF